MAHRNDLINSGIAVLTALDATPLNLVAIVCTTAGNAVLIDSLGATNTVPMIAGQLLPGKFVCLKTASTGAYVGLLP